MVGFRNNPVARNNTIDFTYLNPRVVDYDSVAEVGDTNTVASMPNQGGDSDPSGPNTGYSYIPPLPPMVGTPQPLPDDYEYPEIPSILGTDYVSNTMMYGNPWGPGDLNATQIAKINKNVGDQQAYTLQSAKDFMDAGVHATPQMIHENAWLNQTGFDAQGNYHPEYDPAVAAHAAHMAAIPNYGAHARVGGGADISNLPSVKNAQHMIDINNPLGWGTPDLSGHDVTNTGQGFDFSGSSGHPDHPGSGGK